MITKLMNWLLGKPTIIYRHPTALSNGAINTLKAQAEKHFPNHKCIVLEEGMSIDRKRL